MRQNKYRNIDYWHNKMNNDENVWSGLFDNKPINQDSLIIVPTIFNSYSNQKEGTLAVYPNPESVLGFLQYIYLPTAFANVLDDEDYDDLLSDDLKEFETYEDEDESEKAEVIERIAANYNELDLLWDETDENCLKKIREWSEVFNEKWLEADEAVFSFRIFNSPIALINDVIKMYEEDGKVNSLESELGIKKDAFLAFGEESIYGNKFMSRRFLDILNNRFALDF